MKISIMFNKHIIKLFIMKLFNITKKSNYDANKKIEYNFFSLDLIDKEVDISKIEKLCYNYINHNFNILGTQLINYNTKNENYITNYIGKYNQINWNIDIKSRFQWNNKKKILPNDVFNVPENVDVKYAWELGRLNHFPLLALAYVYTSKTEYLNEITNETIDFISNNKYLFGIQWFSPMDVAIRAINMIISFSIISSHDKNFLKNDKFISQFVKSIYEHGEFIYNNLEIGYKTLNTGNHYFTDIVGLLVISKFFQHNKKVNKWYNFAQHQFSYIVKNHFSKDGTYYEGSTNYHKLSSELLILGSCFIKRSAYLSNKIMKAIDFIINTSYNGNIIQIGDNDSGRILKLSPNGYFMSISEAKKKYSSLYFSNSIKEYFDENSLNCGQIISMSLPFNDNKKQNILYKNNFPIEYNVISDLVRDFSVNNKKKIEQIVLLNKLPSQKFRNIRFKYFDLEEISIKIDIANGKWFYYKDFGLVIYKSKSFYLSMRLNGNRKKKIGHTHNDVFSLNIFNDNVSIKEDSGSYCYMGNRKLREYFIQDVSHHMPLYENKMIQNISVFSRKSYIKKDYININKNVCIYRCFFNNVCHQRNIEIKENVVLIKDSSNIPFRINKNIKLYSNGYGKLMNKN